MDVVPPQPFPRWPGPRSGPRAAAWPGSRAGTGRSAAAGAAGPGLRRWWPSGPAGTGRPQRDWPARIHKLAPPTDLPGRGVFDQHGTQPDGAGRRSPYIRVRSSSAAAPSRHSTMKAGRVRPATIRAAVGEQHGPASPGRVSPHPRTDDMRDELAIRQEPPRHLPQRQAGGRAAPRSTRTRPARRSARWSSRRACTVPRRSSPAAVPHPS